LRFSDVWKFLSIDSYDHYFIYLVLLRFVINLGGSVHLSPTSAFFPSLMYRTLQGAWAERAHPLPNTLMHFISYKQPDKIYVWC